MYCSNEKGKSSKGVMRILSQTLDVFWSADNFGESSALISECKDGSSESCTGSKPFSIGKCFDKSTNWGSSSYQGIPDKDGGIHLRRGLRASVAFHCSQNWSVL